MKAKRDSTVRMIPIDQIIVLNPRHRGRVKFRQIIENIGRIGLKRPITVAATESKDGKPRFHLACGQGRLEAYQALGQTEIPAIVIEATKEELLLMSLIEHLARRQPSGIELNKEIRTLKDRGYSYAEIAQKVGMETPHVRGIIQLLSKGEERLLAAVERRQIPLSVAITIASSSDKAVQRALAEAYEKGDLRGKALIRARRLIENRRTSGKANHRGRANPGRNGTKVSSETLLRAYRKETQRQQMLIQRAKVCETRLLFSVSALKKLFQDENFVNLLRAESLDSLPTFLAEQIRRKEAL
jgi:ParB family transcriptional regulator, chromosome partitioning protein